MFVDDVCQLEHLAGTFFIDNNNALRYHVNVIKSFGDKHTQLLFERRPTRKFPANLHRSALRKLLILHAAESLDDLRSPPGNGLEKLRGNRAYQHSIRINDQWRICFEWRNGDAYGVEIVDYH